MRRFRDSITSKRKQPRTGNDQSGTGQSRESSGESTSTIPNPPRSHYETENSGPPSQNPPPVPSFPDGVKVLYDPPEATIDICFVHGLTGDRDSTWTAHGQSTPWPGTLLPPKLKKARVMTYGYDAYVLRKSVASVNRLADHATNLLADLTTNRDCSDASSRPLIFVSHSLGGLVCKQAILKSRNHADKHLQGIFDNLKGIIFMGTPHKGAWMADWGNVPASALGLVKSINKSLLEVLETDNQYLESIQNSFWGMIREQRECGRDLGVTCFYEELPLTGVGVVVSKESATFPDYGILSIHANHKNMVRFSSAEDNGFIRLLGELLRWEKQVVNNGNTYEMDEKDRQCLEYLRVTDPSEDKERIEETKGGLLAGSYGWILEHADFQKWYDDERSPLLWINGNPGKGKTMLICGIVERMSPSTKLRDKKATTLMSYFFCQATHHGFNNATAVLRGLIYLLVDQQPSLVSHVRKKYDRGAERAFEGVNGWVALSTVFKEILRDLSLKSTYLIVDALDECEIDRPQLLNLVVHSAIKFPHVKWIVSSRNNPDIDARLRLDDAHMRLSLELNEEHVSRAVKMFIDVKVSQLSHIKDKKKVRDQIYAKSNGTFLWAAFVLTELESVPSGYVLQELQNMPSGLESLYGRMIEQVQQLKRYYPEFCRLVLSTMTLAHRPLHLLELGTISGLPAEISNDLSDLRMVVNNCGSFLTIGKDRVYFIHQSAKDFLQKYQSQYLFAGRECERHYIMFSQSMKCMEALKPDIYGCGRPGLRVKDIRAQVVSQDKEDSLLPLAYSCEHWVDHLKSSNGKIQDDDDTHNFLKRHFLHWLEALSLIGEAQKSIGLISELQEMLNSVNSAKLSRFLDDAVRFIRKCRPGIDTAPLQLYSSALIFAPGSSIIRETFQGYINRSWITTKPIVDHNWDPCLQTLEGHDRCVASVAFSNDSRLILSGGHDKTVKIWDTATGSLQRTLEGHCEEVLSVAFSHDSRLIVSASEDGTVKVWETATGSLQRTLEGYDEAFQGTTWTYRYPCCVAFSHESIFIASGLDVGRSNRAHYRSHGFANESQHTLSKYGAVKIWDTTTWTLQQTLEGCGTGVNSVAFSHDSKLLASGNGSVIEIWDTTTWTLQRTLQVRRSIVLSVAFSYNSNFFASGSRHNTIEIWDTTTWTLQQILEDHTSGPFHLVVFSPNSCLVASGSDDGAVRVWDTTNGSLQKIFKTHSRGVQSVVFSHDSRLIASGTWNGTTQIWDMTTEFHQRKLERHDNSAKFLTLSPNSRIIASTANSRHQQPDHTIKIWDATTGFLQHTLQGHHSFVKQVVFSPNSKLLASVSCDCTTKIWDIATGSLQQTFEDYRGPVRPVAFSHDSKTIAAASTDSPVKIWEVATGWPLKTLKGHPKVIESLAFSHDSKLIASGSSVSRWPLSNHEINIWDTETGSLQQTLEAVGDAMSVVFSNDSKLVVSHSFKVVNIWETATWSLQQTIEVPGLSNISYNSWFDATGSYLLVRSGSIMLNARANSYNREFQPEGQSKSKVGDEGAAESKQVQSPPPSGEAIRPHEWGMCLDRSWITWKGTDALWLPTDYRPSVAAVSLSAGIVALGCPSGRVVVVGFSSSGPCSPLKPQ